MGGEGKGHGPRHFSVPICCVSAASQAERNQLTEMRQEAVVSKQSQLTSAFESLERLIKAAEKGKQEEGDPGKIDTLRQQVMELNAQEDMKGVIDAKRMQGVQRSLRFLAFQRRTSRSNT